VAADTSWVSITGTPSGQGDAVVGYAVAPNPTTVSRSASISVGSQRVTVSQAAAACTFGLSSARDSVSSVGGTLSVGVSTQDGCAWQASTGAPWLAITSGQSGRGNGSVVVAVAPNTGSERSSTVTVAGQTDTVTQAAAAALPQPPPHDPPPAPAPEPAPPPPPPPPPPPTPVTISGIVLLVSGRCPDQTFTVGLTTVVTDKTTTYQKGKCGDVRLGTFVTVTGTVDASGQLSADVVAFKEGP
jgi:hypothetical protein